MDEQLEEPGYLDDDLDGRVANLAGALVSLQELEIELLNETRKRKLARMKRQIFDTLTIYCEALLPATQNEEEKKEE